MDPKIRDQILKRLEMTMKDIFKELCACKTSYITKIIADKIIAIEVEEKKLHPKDIGADAIASANEKAELLLRESVDLYGSPIGTIRSEEDNTTQLMKIIKKYLLEIRGYVKENNEFKLAILLNRELGYFKDSKFEDIWKARLYGATLPDSISLGCDIIHNLILDMRSNLIRSYISNY